MCVVLLIVDPSRVAAQVSAAISGLVTDPSGAAVAGAAVTAKNLETATVRVTTTDSAGRYRLFELAVGAYDVTVAKDGFQTIVRGGIHLVVAQHASLDFSLKVGAVQEEVTVTGEISPVSAVTTDISASWASSR